jgi:hypothetical protein
MFIIRAPMKNIEEKKEWSNGHDAFEFLLNCIKECMDLQLLRFENPMIGALSVWAMGHGLVSLDIRCRFKVMDMSEDQVEQAIQASLHEYLRLIRT